MNKILILGICFLLITMPIIPAFPFQNMQKMMPQINKKTTTTSFDNDTPPDWAAGNFTGEWGLNLLGIPLPSSGWIKGYFAVQPGLGRLEAEFAEFNVTNATGQIGGFMIWVFFIGGVISTATGNGTYIAGIGVANESHFYWRLNAIIGPSYYIHCKYSKFED